MECISPNHQSIRVGGGNASKTCLSTAITEEEEEEEEAPLRVSPRTHLLLHWDPKFSSRGLLLLRQWVLSEHAHRKFVRAVERFTRNQRVQMFEQTLCR